MFAGQENSGHDLGISIRRMEEADLAAADRVMRLAFGTFLGMKDPMEFMGDMDFVGTRWRADKAAAFCAVDGGVVTGGAASGRVVVGSVFVGNWGSVGFFGPLTVHPDYWDKGVAQLLMRKVMECFAAWGTRHMGLYTFATSLRHIGLYRKFGFAPRFLTVMMEKKVVAGDTVATESGGMAAGTAAEGGGMVLGEGMAPGTVEEGGGMVLGEWMAPGRVEEGDGMVLGEGTLAGKGWTKFSEVAMGEREVMIERCGAMTGMVLEGLDVRVDIRSVAEQRLGETILLWAGDELVGLAVCHCGPGTEAGSGICFIKFGVVVGSDNEFRRLLGAIEELAVERGMEKLSGGVNTAREEAWAVMLDSGWRGEMAGVAMQCPNEPGYNRPGVYLIDDWR